MTSTLETWLTSLAIGAFIVSTIALAVYGLHLYVLLYLFRRRQRSVRAAQAAVIRDYKPPREEDWPLVTSQIPMYNERNVAARVIEAVARLDYPAGRHEVQVLDDSKDETRNVVDRIVDTLRRNGKDVHVVRRANRQAFKAGALANGLARAKGTYVAVFDADFVPPVDFLRRAVPLLEKDHQLACLQGRWAHLNERESWLTRAQSLGIDGHFAVEQGARAWNGLLMNFNGTAGVWRKTAIDDPDVGGWSGDTLTEDLDLSYRAQLAGWRIDYCLDLPCPAELPNTVKALKGQQRRWATGSIQVARKLLPRIWRRGTALTMTQKIEATLHLTHYSVAVWMLILAVLARPMLIRAAVGHPSYSHWLAVAWLGVLISAVAPTITYVYARYALGGALSAVRVVPSMFVVGLGLCLSNAVAVARGWTQRGGEFIRTPKSGSDAQRSRRSLDRPVQDNLWILELLLGLYMAANCAGYILHWRYAFSAFLVLYAIGFLVIGWCSRPESPHRGPRPAEAPAPLKDHLRTQNTRKSKRAPAARRQAATELDASTV